MISAVMKGVEVIFTDGDIARFWSMVDREDGCWPWNTGRSDRGYGQFWHHGVPYKSHRLAFLFHNNFIDDELAVLHSCDNPPCNNPLHLKQGTIFDNIQDMVQKGRQAHQYGEKHGCCKLTDAEVKLIRELYPNLLQRELAEMFGVTRSQIGHIVTYKSRTVETVR